MTLTRSVDPATKFGSVDAKRTAFARAQSHSRRVRVLKFLLPALAVVFVAGFVAYSWVMSPTRVSIDIGKTAFADGKLVMENPKLDGFTRNKQRYSMTARKAAQTPRNPNVFELEGVEAKLPASADTWATVTADEGIYDREANSIAFTSEVNIQSTDGMKVTLQGATIDMKNGSMTTKKPVDISTDGMQISADSMQVEQNGKILLFKDRVRMEILPGRLKSTEETSGEPDDG